MGLSVERVNLLEVFADLAASAASLKADIEAWKKAKAENEKVLATIGKAKDIERLHAAAADDRQAAEDELAAGVQERASLKMAQDAAHAERVAQFEARRKSEEADYEQRVRVLAEKERTVSDAKTNIEALQAKAQRDAQGTEIARAAMESAQREAEDRLRRIREAAVS